MDCRCWWNIHPVDSLYAFCVGDSGKFWYTSNGGRHVPLAGDGWFEDSTDSDDMNIMNTGEDELNWNADVSESWLNVENDNGSLASQESELMTVTVNCSGLSPDTYYADITLNFNLLIDPVLVIPVELEVTGVETDTISGINNKSIGKIHVFPSPFTDELYIDIRDS
jgi:hypothetical protein